MPDPRPNPPRPVGDPLPATAADLERRSAVGADAIQSARMLWQRAAPDGWQRLIEARVRPSGEGDR